MSSRSHPPPSSSSVSSILATNRPLGRNAAPAQSSSITFSSTTSKPRTGAPLPFISRIQQSNPLDFDFGIINNEDDDALLFATPAKNKTSSSSTPASSSAPLLKQRRLQRHQTPSSSRQESLTNKGITPSESESDSLGFNQFHRSDSPTGVNASDPSFDDLDNSTEDDVLEMDDYIPSKANNRPRSAGLLDFGRARGGKGINLFSKKPTSALPARGITTTTTKSSLILGKASGFDFEETDVIADSIGDEQEVVIMPVIGEQSRGNMPGFGSFEELFVTEEDLHKAQQKLEDEKVKSAEQAFSELVDRLLKFKVDMESHGDIVLDCESFQNVYICNNFVTLGKGSLHIGTDAVTWTGYLNAVAGPTENASTTSVDIIILKFNSSQLHDIRVKVVQSGDAHGVTESGDDDNAVVKAVMMTVNEDTFVQFLFGGESSSMAERCQQGLKLMTVRSLQQGDGNGEVDESSQGKRVGGLVGMVEDSRRVDDDIQRVEEEFRTRVVEAKLKRDAMIRAIEEQYEMEIQALEIERVNEIDRLRSNDCSSSTLIVDTLSAESLARGDGAVQPKECGICCNELEAYELSPCGHALCRSCIVRLLQVDIVDGRVVIATGAVVGKCPWDRIEVSEIIVIRTLEI
ncbi:hypothetical protein HDU76_001693 [Blyttiomyces sp. JEL0837]|nr:hypothetical protein HDU76_001693 [Blyttiomyces sp. JEL0837]